MTGGGPFSSSTSLETDSTAEGTRYSFTSWNFLQIPTSDSTYTNTRIIEHFLELHTIGSGPGAALK
jgi:hypothetical protein